MSSLGAAVPVLRIFDVALARRFYLDRLGFEVEFEHRFAEGLPLYLGIRRGDCRIHLSEHYGDGTPGTAVWIPMRDVVGFRAEFFERSAGEAPFPGIEDDAPGGATMVVPDPFGNMLRFAESGDADAGA
ncbi:VOC family protein [Microbacterium sp. Au-Mic1]|uniref:glyoxalase superfamily protein n=1 Tax=Microbacterium sp. Au-Mic1 TaxID=2906457 RepID=UPI001E586B82|nr:glyoxalase superfamily protein [Microbacterium sp. Au-Mic1]MCE4026990.1 VOC family protein [Microbacterium sp. Au-Mic1]